MDFLPVMQNKKALTALVSETLRHNTLLEILLTKAKIREQEPRLAIPLAKILITELLWGKKRLGGEAKPIQTVVKYQEKFISILSKIERQNRKNGIVTGKQRQSHFLLLFLPHGEDLNCRLS